MLLFEENLENVIRHAVTVNTLFRNPKFEIYD